MTVNHQSAVCHLTTLVNLTFIPPLVLSDYSTGYYKAPVGTRNGIGA